MEKHNFIRLETLGKQDLTHRVSDAGRGPAEHEDGHRDEHDQRRAALLLLQRPVKGEEDSSGSERSQIAIQVLIISSLILDSEICLAAVRGLAQIWHSSLVVTVPFVSAEIVIH